MGVSFITWRQRSDDQQEYNFRMDSHAVQTSNVIIHTQARKHFRLWLNLAADVSFINTEDIPAS